jgi:hypothetical protein
MARRDDTKVSSVFIAGLVGVLSVAALIVLLQVLYYQTLQREETAKVTNQHAEEAATVAAEEMARLKEYRWVDRQKGLAAIPIDRAMDLVVTELAAGKPPGGAPLPPPVVPNDLPATGAAPPAQPPAANPNS